LLPYIFIDGCQGKCIFCEFSGRAGFRVKDPDETVWDLRFLCKACKTNDFMFLNSNINPTRQIAIDFTNRIIKSDLRIRFTDCANFRNLDEEVLVNLKRTGAVRLVIGLESASLRVQKYIGKIIDLNHASNILKICYRLGIWVEVDLLIGLPYEAADDIIATLNFLAENYKYIRSINLNRFILKYGSLMYEDPAKYKITNLRRDPVYNYGYDEIGGLRWEVKRRLMEYRYSRFIGCMHPNKVDYLRPGQFVFIVSKHFSSIKAMNDFLNNIFFKEDSGHKIREFVKELKDGDDIAKVNNRDC
jgi:radical SAM superfamily enzyme YgiQ (UPF0313 family)